MKVLIINGPNLNLLGKREPEIYGSHSFEDYFKSLQNKFSALDLYYFQSNIEGEIVSKIQDLVEQELDGLIINPGAYTHTSIAIRDALSILNIPIVEVHISDIKKRENFRKINLITDLCSTTIIGKGVKGYMEAVDYLYEKN